MPLTVGTHLGPYEVIAPLGAGGMGARGRSERAKRDELQRVGVGLRTRVTKRTPSPCR
jgi:hypothetical protein